MLKFEEETKEGRNTANENPIVLIHFFSFFSVLIKTNFEFQPLEKGKDYGMDKSNEWLMKWIISYANDNHFEKDQAFYKVVFIKNPTKFEMTMKLDEKTTFSFGIEFLNLEWDGLYRAIKDFSLPDFFEFLYNAVAKKCKCLIPELIPDDPSPRMIKKDELILVNVKLSKTKLKEAHFQQKRIARYLELTHKMMKPLNLYVVNGDAADLQIGYLPKLAKHPSENILIWMSFAQVCKPFNENARTMADTLTIVEEVKEEVTELKEKMNEVGEKMNEVGEKMNEKMNSMEKDLKEMKNLLKELANVKEHTFYWLTILDFFTLFYLFYINIERYGEAKEVLLVGSWDFKAEIPLQKM